MAQAGMVPQDSFDLHDLALMIDLRAEGLGTIQGLAGQGQQLTNNMNSKFVGRLGLSDEEENALVSFMRTLTDGFTQR